MKTTEYRDFVASIGAEVFGDTPAEFARFMALEIDRRGKVVRAAGVKVD